MSEDSINENLDQMRKTLDEKKSKKKKIITGSIIGTLVPVILAIIYVLNPHAIIDNSIEIKNFPAELIGQYDTICIHDQIGKSCLIKNDGKIKLSSDNGVRKFQTDDYSLIKHFDTDSGYEEKSISEAFYEQTSMVKTAKSNGVDYWIVTAKGR